MLNLHNESGFEKHCQASIKTQHCFMSLFLIDGLKVHLSTEEVPMTIPRMLSGHVSFTTSRDVSQPAYLLLKLVSTETLKYLNKPMITQTRTSSLPGANRTLMDFPDGITHGSYTVPFQIAVPKDFPASAQQTTSLFRVQVSTRMVARLEAGTLTVMKEGV